MQHDHYTWDSQIICKDGTKVAAFYTAAKAVAVAAVGVTAFRVATEPATLCGRHSLEVHETPHGPGRLPSGFLDSSRLRARKDN